MYWCHALAAGPETSHSFEMLRTPQQFVVVVCAVRTREPSSHALDLGLCPCGQTLCDTSGVVGQAAQGVAGGSVRMWVSGVRGWIGGWVGGYLLGAQGR